MGCIDVCALNSFLNFMKKHKRFAFDALLPMIQCKEELRHHLRYIQTPQATDFHPFRYDPDTETTQPTHPDEDS